MICVQFEPGEEKKMSRGKNFYKDPRVRPTTKKDRIKALRTLPNAVKSVFILGIFFGGKIPSKVPTSPKIF
jgi:hypothetical protein